MLSTVAFLCYLMLCYAMLLCFMLLKMCFTFLSANGEINGFHMSIDDDTKMTHASDATRYENVWQFIDANARKFSDCLLT